MSLEGQVQIEIDFDDQQVQALMDRFHFQYLDAGLKMNPEDIDQVVEEMVWSYQSPYRRHHTLRHIGEIHDELQPVVGKLLNPAGVSFAVDMHDVVQISRAFQHDVELSLQWGQTVLDIYDPPLANFASYKSCVMATQHTGDEPDSVDAQYMSDADLSILGKPPKRYDEYAKDIQFEFRWVPKSMFRARRAEVLQGFLERPRIYWTTHFYDLYEEQARENLRREIAKLTKT